MEHLGLHTTVTTEEWLQCARRFSSEVIDRATEYRSGVLLSQLIKMTKINNDASRSFLQKVTDIKFLYSSETYELNVILSHLFPEECTIGQNKMKFSGSVTVQQANIACLSRPVLPKSCQPLINQSFSKQALRIEDPISPKTVAENLKCLCERVSVSCRRSLTSNQRQVTKLIGIFEKHYALLSKQRPPQSVLRELIGVQCILRSKSPLLQLVRPSQLVMQLPLDCSLEPYCYRVSPWLQKYVDFLIALGVRQVLKVQDYIDILATVHNEHDDDTTCNTNKSVIEAAYKLLIHHLRQDPTLRRLTGDVYLPDEAMNLRRSTALCLNDAPWYRSRLPPNCTLKIILQPPVDDEGHRTLPDVLKIKRLSKIIVEKMLESCKSPDFTCTDEELFALGRRPESGRCVFVRNILDTLKSDELFEGFCRIFYTEYNCPPTKSFKHLVKKLKEVKIHCINTEIKTVLYFNGEVLPNTEDSNKLCHLTKENKVAIIYISPHNKNIDGGKFLNDLADCISKLMNNEIKNMVPIAAVFECHPSDIPQVLTRQKICEYIVGNTATSQAITIGSPIAWKNVPPQDSVIVLNYQPNDTVCYICDNGSLIYAEVLRCESGKQPAFQLLEPILTIRVGELSIAQNIDADSDGNDDVENDSTHDSDDSEEFFSASEGAASDDGELGYDSDHHDGRVINYSDPAILRVSPMKIFRMISVSQRRSLSGVATSPFACPVALATVPVDSRASFEQWIEDFYNSQLFTTHCGLIQTVLTLRLLDHLHNQLVICRKNPALLGQAIQKVSNTFNLVATVQANSSQQEQSVINVLTNIIRDAPSDVRRLFPTEALGKILDIASSQHPATQGGSSNASRSTFPNLGVLLGNLQRYMNVSSWLPTLSFRRGYRNSPIHPVTPQALREPDICMRSATAWLLQAKADFCAAQSLFITLTEGASPGGEMSVGNSARCDFPALVCFLCHDTVEKSIKGILYAFCGLGQELVNCSNLVMLHDALDSSPHHPEALMSSIKECVMVVNRHENRSRFPNYHNPPCAPASTYNLKDAQEAFAATERLLHCLKSQEKLQQELGDLTYKPAVIPTLLFQSSQNSSGMPSPRSIIDVLLSPGPLHLQKGACRLLYSACSIHY